VHIRDGCASDASLEREYSQHLAALQAPPARLREDSAERKITRTAIGRLHVSGNAEWVGDAAAGNVHTSEVDGTFALEGDSVHYDAEGCRFMLTFTRGGLAVSDDNAACGGMNVTFDGDYMKTTTG
jgi:hypothetical protein